MVSHFVEVYLQELAPLFQFLFNQVTTLLFNELTGFFNQFMRTLLVAKLHQHFELKSIL
jgi:hypothetical protein